MKHLKGTKRAYVSHERCVYVVDMHAGGVLKIGMTYRLPKRLKELTRKYVKQTHEKAPTLLYCTDVHIIGALVELAVHEALVTYRYNNGVDREMFLIPPERAIAEVKKQWAYYLKDLTGRSGLERISIEESAAAYIAFVEKVRWEAKRKKLQLWPSAVRDGVDNT